MVIWFCLKFNVNFYSSVQNAIQRPALCLFPLCKNKIVCLGYFSLVSILGFNNNTIRDRYITALESNKANGFRSNSKLSIWELWENFLLSNRLEVGLFFGKRGRMKYYTSCLIVAVIMHAI